VPDLIAEAASEAWACYSIRQLRAATLMARTTVEAICKDQGITKGNLVSKIDALYTENKISQHTKEAAHEIRDIGNDSAHGDLDAPLNEEMCADILSFMDSMLEEVYQRPAKLNRFRASRTKT